MRRTTTTLLMTAALVLTAVLPASAQPEWFSSDTVEADQIQELSITAPEPTDGVRTRLLVVTAPSAFKVTEGACSIPLSPGWSCSTRGQVITFRTENPDGINADLYNFEVQTPKWGGAFSFNVVQTYNDDSSDEFTKMNEQAPVLTVNGPDPTEGPADNETDQPTDQPTESPTPTPTTEPTDGATTPAASGRKNQTAGGSAAPSRTTRGTTFNVTPGDSVAAGDGVDAPDIAAPADSVAQAIDPDNAPVDLDTDDAGADAPGGALRWVGLGLVGIGGGTGLLRRRMAKAASQA
jgi:hypothetical protein